MFDFHFTVMADTAELLKVVKNLREEVMADLTRLKEAVQRIEDRGDAAIELLHGLAQQIRDNAANEAELRDLADKIDAQAAELDEAVVANTPSEPTE